MIFVRKSCLRLSLKSAWETNKAIYWDINTLDWEQSWVWLKQISKTWQKIVWQSEVCRFGSFFCRWPGPDRLYGWSCYFTPFLCGCGEASPFFTKILAIIISRKSPIEKAWLASRLYRLYVLSRPWVEIFGQVFIRSYNFLTLDII